ncbi:McrB family protein [Flavobacterium sp.]|uniref:McrB family protein n=1 Tax=Flavobacterium sp. TaxID=239 RepID=UPI002B4B4FD0|nr:AAA family ATPase [Flavobacterium sp.]HLP64189.1 AAA family ATPase [Flavobacterium sp.]
MKISKKVVLESFNKLSHTTNNKFWGLLSIFKTINEKYGEIESNITYEIDSSKISEILDNWFYLGDDFKNYNSNNIYLHFSSNWINVFNNITSNGKPNILDVAIFYFKNDEFEKVTTTELVDLFKKSIKLSETFLSLNFDLNVIKSELILEKSYNRTDFFNFFKTEKSIDLDCKTLSFSSPFLIVSKPSELKRAPFIQTLYSGTEIMELLIIADFNINDYYFSNKIDKFQIDVILENKTLYKVIFEAFKYIFDNYGQENVLKGYEEKNAKIENRNYKGIILSKYFGFEVLLALFENEQTEKGLQSGNTSRFVDEKIIVLNNQNSYFTNQWNAIENGRGLSLKNFNKLLADISKDKLEIIRKEDIYKLISKRPLIKSSTKESQQIIYYGAPGTGKSHKVNEILNSLNSNFYERITFHPEFDNATFVGGYKPVSDDNINGNNVIKYRFVPQSFTNIYVKAWNDLDNHYFLAIEEINRGNCAEIFGEIFQLLDRNNNYTVSPSNELKNYLNKSLINKEGISDGLKLPPNLSILATMNTSDQSLFPMDSAFKRRWDWEYIPICYDDIPENESFGYDVKIDENTSFKWIDFIKNVNGVIKTNTNLGMDKCIGNYFIKSNSKEITLKEFINKAVFYLWNDVFKDEDDSIFEKGTSYEDFFPIEETGKENVLKILKKLNIEPTIV